MDIVEQILVDALKGNMKRGVSERVIASALARDIRAALEQEIMGNLYGTIHAMLFPVPEPWQPDDDDDLFPPELNT